IYRELGSGRRISLAKLATEKLESSGRPLRIAVDIAIWQFQTQAARGGTNPAIRTLFYRLVRLLGLGIQPIFVFDGPHKPTFKRNKRSGRGDGIATAMAKRVIRLFGFPIHDAPGEAEAECALLQQQGIVDAVLSEDVDTIMFGCTRTLRNWTAEGPRGAKTPTHVSLYDVDELLSAGTGLDREGMVLVALMSGGDYIPEGVPGCGVKLACEAAKAGFGKSLCRLKSDDDVQFEEWRRNLRHELRTNESGFFRVRHKALSIPDEFPSRQVLRHYTHPVVSNAIAVNKLKTEVNWSRPMDVQGLRYFVEETFDWVNKIGAVKLTRVLSPGLLELDEVVSFDRQGLALNSDDEFEAAVDGDTETAGGKTRAKSTFDPTVAELIWLPESLIKLSAPLTVEDWEEKQRSKALPRASRKTAKTTKINNKKATRATLHEAGALDKWVQITTSGTTSQNKSLDDSDSQLPPLTRPTLRSPIPPKRAPASTSVSSQLPTPLQSSVNRSKQSRSNGKATAAAEPTGHKNPWAHAGSQHMPRITKSQQPAEPIVLSSSPMRASPAPACSSMSPLSPQHIIDLSGPDDTYLFKPSKPPKPFAPHSQQAASRGNQSIKARSMRGSSPTLPCTPPKSKRAMKQTRMDSFITASPKQPVIEESQTQPSTWEGNGSQTYINASQTIVSSSFGYNKQVGTSVSRITKASATWTDYDDDFPPAPKTGALEQTKRMVVPRTSVVGFFKVVEMSDEEEVGRKKTTSPKPFMKSAWRRSEVSIIDLTGDDE
ncbi:flap structure-specific endonuclease, partial [Colletotrichum incanum]